MKKIIILFQFCLVSIVLISFTLAYTAQSYDSVDLVLDIGYTNQGNKGYAAQDYESVDLILGLPDTCNCPASGSWDIINGDSCYLSNVCDIGDESAIIQNGSLRILSGGQLRSGGFSFEENQSFAIEDGGGLSINDSQG